MLDPHGELLLVAVGLFLGACAIQNTPQQDLAYARWAKCDAPYVQLDRVEVDGRITFRFSSEGARQEVLQCLAEAGRTGPSLPTPVGDPPPSGPVSDQRGRLDGPLWALRTWLDSWAGIGRIAAGMARQGYDLKLTRYDERGWRATFYTTGGWSIRRRARPAPHGSQRPGTRFRRPRETRFGEHATMVKPRPERKRECRDKGQLPLPTSRQPDSSNVIRVLPMQLQPGDRLADEPGEWEVASRPYTSSAGKTASVRVRRVGQPGRPEVLEIRSWGAHERIVVRRA